jgi:hypothetical protein
MKDFALFTDKIGGTAFVDQGKKTYLKTKDSSSPSGHTLVAQIEMTHSGIVTANYGFYLPDRMRDGSGTFTQDYNKPIIVGHDEKEEEEATPIGRVVQADYINTASELRMKDSYLDRMYKFQDKKTAKSSMLKFVNHVIDKYDSMDGYSGLGHILGTLHVSDEEAIERILDERYLTVSTSMATNSVTCSSCGQDWAVDGQCEHQRGGIYNDKVMVLIPGKMRYDHLGVVNNPADKNASGFNILQKPSQFTDKKDKDVKVYAVPDKYNVAAKLFAYDKNSLISLSDKHDVNLFEVKDNIQNMENAMAKNKKDNLETKLRDALDVDVRIFRYGEEEKSMKSVSVNEYVKDLDELDLKKMVEQIAGMMDGAKTKDDTIINDKISEYFKEELGYELKDSEEQIEDESEEDAAHKSAPQADKYKGKKKKKSKKMSDSFKLEDGEEIDDDKLRDKIKEIKDSKVELEDSAIEELAEALVLSEMGDPIASLVFGDTSDVKESVERLTLLKDAEELKEMSQDRFFELLNEELGKDSEITKESVDEMKASDFCGVKGFFPVTDGKTYDASRRVLAKIKAPDSVKGRILASIEKKADKLGISQDSFDNNAGSCNNNQEVSTEDLLNQYDSVRTELEKRGHEFNDSSSDEAEQEIQILEAQLEAANEEVDSVIVERDSFKEDLIEQLAGRVVDLKILSDSVSVDKKDEELEEHKTRSVESLKDSLKDLGKQVNLSKLSFNDGTSSSDAPNEEPGDVSDPTIKVKDKNSGSTKELKMTDEQLKSQIYDNYNKMSRVYGKKYADSWLKKVNKKYGLNPTID